MTEVTPLATGKIDGFTAGTWHNLALSLKGNEITASVDSQCGRPESGLRAE
jgi:hypothetical protein